MPLQDILVGAGIGSIISRLLVYRAEHRGGEEWPAMRVRQVEAYWITVGITTFLGFRVLFS
jgi:hypothetical protein